MKIKDKRLSAFLATTLVFTLAACVIKAVALMTDFNYESGYFIKKSLSTASVVLLAICICICATHFFIGQARSDISPSFHGAATYIPSGLLAISLIFYTRETIGTVASSGSVSAASVMLLILKVICAAGSVVYLFLNAFLGSRYSCVRGAFAISVIVFLILCAIRIYFDKAEPINVPNKSSSELAYISAAVFFTLEARLSLGREKWRAYIPLGLVAIAMTAYASVPELTVYIIKAAKGVKDFSLIGSSLGSAVLCLALSVFITARIATVAFLKSNRSGALASYAAEKTREGDGTDERTDDENQISIDDIIDSGDGTADAGEEL